jgi:hypothetical protein
MSTTVTLGQVILFAAFLVIAAASIGIWYWVMRSLDYTLRGDDGWWSTAAVIGHIVWALVLVGWLYLMFWALVLR